MDKFGSHNIYVSVATSYKATTQLPSASKSLMLLDPRAAKTHQVGPHSRW